MEITGPCFVYIHNGKIYKKYLVSAHKQTPLGVYTTSYFFEKKEDAETYYWYLLQVDGEEFLNRVISSSRTYLWEKEEYQTFKDSIDFSVLERKVKNIKFEKEETFVEAKKRCAKKQ